MTATSGNVISPHPAPPVVFRINQRLLKVLFWVEPSFAMAEQPVEERMSQLQVGAGKAVMFACCWSAASWLASSCHLASLLTWAGVWSQTQLTLRKSATFTYQSKWFFSLSVLYFGVLIFTHLFDIIFPLCKRNSIRRLAVIIWTRLWHENTQIHERTLTKNFRPAEFILFKRRLLKMSLSVE